MGMSRKELRDSVLNTTRQPQAQIGDLVNEFINLTIQEINSPSWAFKNPEFHHLWSFLRQKTTFPTVASTSDYVLAREVDKIAILRQTASPVKLRQLSDETFFRYVPDPTATGNPSYYRIWEASGVATKLGTASTLTVVSDSTSDAGSAELTVSISGYVGGIWRTETFALNGTTEVAGSLTFQARELIVTKQKNTTGTITIATSGDTTLTTLGPKDRLAKFKVVSLYPIPSSAITMYLEFYTTIPELHNDSDAPIFDEKWHHIIRLGTLSKVYQYLNKEDTFALVHALFTSAVRAMVASDRVNPDFIEYLDPRASRMPFIHISRSEDVTVD